ncbi:MAG: hypothetical protein J6U61_06545, partial [Lachnospiraceae bacterium]|nr:hypothetical protein [Lachnospiraceae bacterium]
EDGTVNKYVIYAAREQENTAPSGDTPETTGTPAGTDEPGSTEQTQEGGNKNTDDDFYFWAEEDEESGQIVLRTKAKYTIVNDPGTIKIPEGYFKTSIVISKKAVTAYSPTQDLSSDFLLLILSKNGGEPELYTFDRVERTVQRFSSTKKDATINTKTASGYSNFDDAEQAAAYEKSLHNLTLVIAIMSGICMLLLILTIRMALKSKEQKREHARRPSSRSGSSRR